MRLFPACLLLLFLAPTPAPAAPADPAAPAQTRTVHRCLRDGTVSLSTAPEPGSRCTAITFDANAARLPDLWKQPGVQQGVLYQRQQDGRTVYGTRKLPGSTEVLAFAVPAPPGAQAHAGLGAMGPPRLDAWPAEFRKAAKTAGVDEAWLRTIAHLESGYVADAVSDKGALGVMQLMPDTATEYGVTDALDPRQSIAAGARHLRSLWERYDGDLVRVAAAYNAGIGTVERYGGVPPYAETRTYVDNAQVLYLRYRAALKAAERTPD